MMRIVLGADGLEICEPHEVERAARIYHRDGFGAPDALGSRSAFQL